jgi:hypothetical protein
MQHYEDIGGRGRPGNVDAADRRKSSKWSKFVNFCRSNLPIWKLRGNHYENVANTRYICTYICTYIGLFLRVSVRPFPTFFCYMLHHSEYWETYQSSPHIITRTPQSTYPKIKPSPKLLILKPTPDRPFHCVRNLYYVCSDVEAHCSGFKSRLIRYMF